MPKRHFSRVPFQAEANLRWNKETQKGKVENLSLKGMLLKTDMPQIPVGDSVDVEILLSGSSSRVSIGIQGKVVRKEPEGLAIFFTSMHLDSFVHLKNVISFNLGDEDGVMDEFQAYLEGLQK